MLLLSYLYFESEVFLHIFHNHNQVRQFDAQSLGFFGRTRDVRCADVRADDVQHQRLDIVVRDALDMSVSNGLVPKLQGFTAYAVEYRQKAALERVFKHGGRLLRRSTELTI